MQLSSIYFTKERVDFSVETKTNRYRFQFALRRINGLLLSPLPPFAHLNEDIFIENR